MIKSITFKRDFHPFSIGETFGLKPITMLVGDQGAGKSTLIDLLVKYDKPRLTQVNDRYKIEGGAMKTTGKRGDYYAQNIPEPDQFIEIDPADNPHICFVDTEKHNPRMTRGETTKEFKDAMIESLRDDVLIKIISVFDGLKGAFPDKIGILDHALSRVMENAGKEFDSKRNGGTIIGDELEMDVATVATATMQSHGQSIFPLIQKSTEGKKGYAILLDEPETALSVRSQHKLTEILKKLSEHNQLIIATHSPIIMQLADDVLSLEHRKWMKAAEFLETQKQLEHASN